MIRKPRPYFLSCGSTSACMSHRWSFSRSSRPHLSRLHGATSGDLKNQPSSTGKESLPMEDTIAQQNKSITILAIDDEPYILRALSYLLTREGYTIETAND